MQAPVFRPADTPVDISADEPADGQWLTLAELGHARGISKASAARLVRRKRWRRQSDNQGRVRVFVPPDAIEPDADSPADGPAGSQADMSRAISVLEAAIAASGERAAADAATIASLQAYLASERARAEAAEDRAADLRERVDAAQAEAERARAAAQAAQDRARAAERVDAARQASGLVARLARAEAAEARADAAEGRAHRAEQGRDAERALGDVLRDRIEGLQAQVAAAEANAETARASAREAAQTADALRKAEAELQARLATFFEPQEADAEQNTVTIAELREQTGRLQIPTSRPFGAFGSTAMAETIFVDAAEKDAAGKAAQAAFLGRVGFWAYVPLFVLLVLVFGGGMILASLDLLPLPRCGTTVNWWSWCLRR